MQASFFVKSSLLLTFFFSLNFLSFSQQNSTAVDSTQRVVVELANGLERIGFIVSDDRREIILRTEEIGEIYISKVDIVSIKKMSDEDLVVVNGEISRIGPFTTRYQFTTNALPIKKGEDYMMLNLFGPEVHIAVNDHFTAGVMTSWIGAPIIGAFKYSLPTVNEKLNFGIGSLLGTSGYLGSFGTNGGLLWGMATYGTRQKNITFSAGYMVYSTSFRNQVMTDPGTYQGTLNEFGYYDYNFVNTETLLPTYKGPVFSIAGTAPLGKKASFVFDFMVVNLRQKESRQLMKYPDGNDFYGYYSGSGNDGQPVTVTHVDNLFTALIYMPGVRYQTASNKAIQIAIAGVTLTRSNSSFPLPSFSWFYKF